MFKGTLSCLDANAEKTAAIPSFEDSITEFRGVVNAIRAKETQMGEATKGKTSAKNIAEDELIYALMPIASALYMYGGRKKDTTIMEKSDVRESYLRRMRDTELVIKANAIHTMAVENAGNITPSGIADAQIAAFLEKINTYDKSLGERESSSSVRTGARMSLTELFAKGDDILENDIDRRMELLRATYPEFYNEYFAARVIKDLGIRHEDEEPPPAP